MNPHSVWWGWFFRRPGLNPGLTNVRERQIVSFRFEITSLGQRIKIKTKRYIAIDRGKPIPVVVSGGLNGRLSKGWAVEYNFWLDPR